MSGPTLALGISTLGVDQVKQLADAVGKLDTNLASLQARSGGGGGAGLSGLSTLTAEVAKIRQGLSEAAAGLRTELADLKSAVTKNMSDAFTSLASTARTGGKQVSDEVTKAAADTTRAAELYKNAAKQVAVAMNNATGDFTRFNSNTGLKGGVAQQLIDQATMMDAAVLKFRDIQARQLADQLAFEEKQKASWAAYQAALEQRLAVEATAMDGAVLQFRSIQQKQVADQIAFEEKQKLSWFNYQVALEQRLAQEATMMDGAVLQFRAIQQKQVADQVAFEEKQKLAWFNYQTALAARLAEEATMMDGAVAKFRAIQDKQLANQIAFEEKQKAAWYSYQAAMAAAAAKAAPVAALTAEVEKSASALDHLSFQSTRAKAELYTLADEAIQGRTRNFAGSLLVLARNMGAAQITSVGLVASIAAIAAPFVIATLAIEKGALELESFQKQAILTGNAVGISSSQFTTLRDSLVGVAVTKGAAADALTAIAKSGLLASDNIKEIANTAILLDRAVGQPIETTVKQFEELGKSPAEASAKLNEQYHYLTVSVYDQINALEQQGKVQEAATLAEKTYADEMSHRAQEILDNQGYLEQGWHGVANAAKEAWDAMLGIGRKASPADQMQKAGDQIDLLQSQLQQQATLAAAGQGPFAWTNTGTPSGTTSAVQAQVDSYKESMQNALRRSEIEGETVTAMEAQNRAAEAAVKWDQQGNSLAQTRQGLEDQITRARQLGIEAGRSEEQIQERIAQIRAKYNRGNGASRAASIAGQGDAADAQSALYTQLMADNNTTPVSQLTGAEKQLFTLEAQLGDTADKTAQAHIRLAIAAAQAAVAQEKNLQLTKNQYDAWIKDTTQIVTFAAENDKSTESIRKKTAEVQNQIDVTGKSTTVIQEAILAEDKKQLQEADATYVFDPKYVASLRNKTQAQEDYVKVLQEQEGRQIALKLSQEEVVNTETTAQLQQEATLLGVTAERRAEILATYKAQLELAKQLDQIEKSQAPNKDDLKAQATADAKVAAENAAAKKVLTSWEKTADSINTSLTDAVINGFENGKGAAASLADFVKNLFNNMILRPIIQAVMAPISGQIAQQVTGIQQYLLGGAGTGGGNLIGQISNGFGGGGFDFSSISNTVGGWFGGSTGAAGGAVNIGTASADDIGMMYAGGSADAASTLGIGGGGGAAGALGGMSSAIPYVGALFAASQGQYGSAAGMAIGTAILPGIGTVIGGVLGSLFDGKGGGPKQDGRSSAYVGVAGTNGTAHSAANDQSAQAASDALQTQYDAITKAYGGTDSLQYGMGFSTDPQGTAPSFAEFTATNGGALAFNDQNGQIGRSSEEMQAATTALANRALIQGLQQSNIQGLMGKYINGLDLGKLSDSDIATAASRINTALGQRTQLQTQLDDLTLTADQKLTKTRDAERAAIDDTNKSLLEQVYAQQDLQAASAKLVTAYQNDASKISAQISGLHNYSAAINSFLSGFVTGSQSPLGGVQLTQANKQLFDSTLLAAHAGDENARQSLTGVAGNYLSNLSGTATSAVDYAMKSSYVTSSLSGEAGSADYAATLLQQQLDTETNQLKALGLINDSVESFQQAWSDYQTAKDAAAAAAAAAASDQNSNPGTVVSTTPVDPASIPGSPAWLAKHNILGYGDITGAGDSAGIGGDSSGSGSSTSGVGAGGDSAGGVGGAGSGFASGGYHRGGIRLVGEDGPELEVTGSSYIYDTAATRRLLARDAGSGDASSASVTEELRMLRLETRANVGFTYQLAKDFRELKTRGFPVTNTQDGTALNTHAV